MVSKSDFIIAPTFGESGGILVLGLIFSPEKFRFIQKQKFVEHQKANDIMSSNSEDILPVMFFFRKVTRF